MSTICRCCGEFLSQHKDGRCDPVAARQYRRDQQNRFSRQTAHIPQSTLVSVLEREPVWHTVD